jgi:hypothetical protein
LHNSSIISVRSAAARCRSRSTSGQRVALSARPHMLGTQEAGGGGQVLAVLGQIPTS